MLYSSVCEESGVLWCGWAFEGTTVSLCSLPPKTFDWPGWLLPAGVCPRALAGPCPPLGTYHISGQGLLGVSALESREDRRCELLSKQKDRGHLGFPESVNAHLHQGTVIFKRIFQLVNSWKLLKWNIGYMCMNAKMLIITMCTCVQMLRCIPL